MGILFSLHGYEAMKHDLSDTLLLFTLSLTVWGAGKFSVQFSMLFVSEFVFVL